MSFEMNKIIGAILAAMLLAMVSGFIASGLVSPRPLKNPAYMVATATPAAAIPATTKPPTTGGKATPAAQPATTSAAQPATATAAAGAAAAGAAPAGGAEPIGQLLATASVDDGKSQARKCGACHTFDKDGPNRIGPNLYGIVGEPIAEGHNGYSFSSALSGHKGEKWTIDALNSWLTKPSAFAQGTKMTFVGVPSAKDRADIIAYLNSLSDNPKPLPASAGAPAPAPQATATPAPQATATPALQAVTPAPAAATPPAPAAATAAPPQAAAAPPPAPSEQAAPATQQASAEDQAGVEPIGSLLAGASVDAGKDQARKCALCHTFDKGAPNRIGPNLYDIVGQPIAEGRNGYAFSSALAAHKGETWTPDELNRWLSRPQSFARGTKMVFTGIAGAQDRANVIAYLNSLSDSPKPLAASK
jgi:cytochrome c